MLSMNSLILAIHISHTYLNTFQLFSDDETKLVEKDVEWRETLQADEENSTGNGTKNWSRRNRRNRGTQEKNCKPKGRCLRWLLFYLQTCICMFQWVFSFFMIILKSATYASAHSSRSPEVKQNFAWTCQRQKLSLARCKPKIDQVLLLRMYIP